jgi:hypothetical protein
MKISVGKYPNRGQVDSTTKQGRFTYEAGFTQLNLAPDLNLLDLRPLASTESCFVKCQGLTPAFSLLLIRRR